MKNSHFSAPRTLSECQFDSGYPLVPITPPAHMIDSLVDLCIAALAVGVCAAIAMGWLS